jgi:pyruvate/2-oxoglutarate dehydrogenase complex dihydrolipoamide acyltransferase (E2) component
MAKDLGVDINLLSGSGPAGRVTKKDVEKAAINPIRLLHHKPPLRFRLAPESDTSPSP